jgi:phosphatidylinositol alpha-mannosyltransferase
MRNGKLKIAFVFDDSLDRNDGVQQYIRVVANWLHHRGHTIHYFVGETNDAKGFPGTVHSLSKNVSVKGNGNHMSIPRSASSTEIEELLKRLRPDVLHVQMPFSPMMGAKVINLSNDSTAVLATFHIVGERIFERLGSKALSLATKKATNRIDRLISVSEPAQDYALKHYKIDSEILPNAVELSRFHAANSKRQTRPTILFLGRLVKRKGADLLLAAVANERVRLADMKARILIAGDGPMRQKLEDMVDEYGLRELVHFLGYVEESNKPDLLSSADLAVFPSTGGESFGIVLIEAMATNGPVVLAGDNVGYRSVIGKQFQMIINPSDSINFGRQMVKLLTDKELRNSLKRWQGMRVKDFDIQTVGPELEKLYYKTIKAKAKS